MHIFTVPLKQIILLGSRTYHNKKGYSIYGKSHKKWCCALCIMPWYTTALIIRWQTSRSKVNKNT